MTKHHEIPASHFNNKTLKTLTKKGIAIVGMTALPVNGSYLNTQTGYELNNNGTGQIKNYLQVLEMAQ